MSDLFISYSRQDRVFVRRLFTQLESKAYDAWVDWEDIASAAPNFFEEIYGGIESADAFLLIMTPASLKSEICNLEISHAVKHHKRIIPVVYLDVSDRGKLKDEIVGAWLGTLWEKQAQENWEVLRRINWLMFQEGVDFDSAFANLVDVLKADLDYIKFHTRLTVRAVEWEQKEQSSDFVLRGNDLTIAEGWLAISQTKQPSPTPLQKDFVTASTQIRDQEQEIAQQQQQRELALQRRAVQRLRYLVTTLGLFLVVSGGLSLFAFRQRDAARNASATSAANEMIAERRADVAQSLSWAANAQQLYDGNNPMLGLSLAFQANKIPDPPAEAQKTFATIAYGGIIQGVLEGHTGSVHEVVITEDGRTAISVSEDRSLIVWDLETRTIRHRLLANMRNQTYVAVSADGRTAISGSISRIDMIVWDLEAGTQKYSLDWHQRAIRDVVISRDGKTAVSASEDGTLIVWDLETGTPRHWLSGHHGWVIDVEISPDGRTAVSRAVPFPGDSDSSDFRSVMVWDLETGTPQHVLFENNAGDIAISPNGKMVLVMQGQTLHTFDLSSGEIITTKEIAANPAGSMIVSADGSTSVLVSSENQLIMLWDLETGRMTNDANDFLEQTVAAPNGQISISWFNNPPTIWGLETGESILALREQSANVFDVAIAPDSHTALAGLADGNILIWNLDVGAILQRWRGHEAMINDLAISRDGRLLISASSDNTLAIWDIINHTLVRTLTGHTGVVHAVTFGPDGETVVSASGDGTVIIWRLDSGEVYRVLSGQEGMNNIAVTSDGKTVIAGSDLMSVWDVNTGELLRTMRTLHGLVYDTVLYSNGHIAVSAVETNIVIWDIETRRILQTLQGHTDLVTSVVLSPDERLVVSGSDDETVIVWDLDTRAALRTLRAHTDAVNSVVVSPDGKTIFSGSEDKTIVMWNLDTGEAIRTFQGHTTGVTSLAITPDGRRLISGSRDGVLIAWRVDTLADLIKWTATNRYIHEFTCEERRSFNVVPLCEPIPATPQS